MKNISASEVVFNLGSLIGDISECGIKLTGYTIGGIVRKSHKDDIAEYVEITSGLIGKGVNVTFKVSSTFLGKGVDLIFKKTKDIIMSTK